MRVDPEEIEHLITVKRTAKAARRALGEPEALPEAGAVVTFPVAVFAPGSRPGSNPHFWSYRVSHEPGSVFPRGCTTVRYRGAIDGVEISGRFEIVVGHPDPATVAPAGVEADGVTAGPRWVASLPSNVWAPALGHDRLVRALQRAARREDEATDRLMATAYPFLDQIADSFGPQLRHRRAYLDREDVISEGWKRAYQLIDAFSSPNRPSAPWSTAVYRNCRRDMSRAVHALDGMSEAVATIRAACGAYPNVTDPVVMEELLAVQAEQRRLRLRHPELSADERRRRAEADHPRCPFSRRQIMWAMEAPRIVSWYDTASRVDIESGDSGDHHQLLELRTGIDDVNLASVEAPAAVAARCLADASDADLITMLDVMTDLGVGSGGDARSARLPQLRRRVLAPFILPGEKPGSEAVLRRAGHRARTKLFADGELLGGPRLAEAWQAGISAEEAHAADALLDA
ncbi:MAG: hypothetical protein M3137_20670 [Actinomycetota bacterium]|nr:hypothetical protein [Actinomycetota bacterium]